MSVADGDQVSDTEKSRNIITWIDTNIGGVIERFEQQPRWRGGWWVDVRRGGDELLKLYVREERKEDYPPWPLEHEVGVLQVLEKYGVPVPHVYGIINAPHAAVMDALPGECDFSQVSEAEGVAVLYHFAEVLAKMHSIPPEELVKLGVKMPRTPEEVSLGCFKICEEMYLKGKQRAEPRVEFLRRWVYRNIPKHRTKVSVIAVDSGQFLFKDGAVTGLYDFEYGCLGDPMIDLAFIPLRLSMHKAGDLRPLFRRYAELTGETFELEVLAFHAVWWGLCTPFILTADLQTPPASAKYFEYVGWYIGSIISQLEVLGDMKGLDLDKSYNVAAPQPSRWAAIFDVMAARVPPATAGEAYDITEQRKAWEFSRRMDASRDMEGCYLKEVECLVGRSIDNWQQADEELERFVISAGPEQDDVLIALFHRWAVVQAKSLLDGLVHLPMFDRSWPRLSRIIG